MKFAPKLVIFDVDGVLVDVHGSFHRSILDTVQALHRAAHDLRRDSAVEDAQSGYNDDWRLTTDWVNSLGKKVPIRQGEARSFRNSIGA